MAFRDRLDEVACLGVPKEQLMGEIIAAGVSSGYRVADIDIGKPWGGFVRFDGEDSDKFVHEFFPGLEPEEARLGVPEAELSPKILLVLPQQRLSWQLHHRRAERWVFLTAGGYYRSQNPDEMGELVLAKPGDVVQFAAGECHRLVSDQAEITLVAEIWQHTDKTELSNEADIVRLADDYKR